MFVEFFDVCVWIWIWLISCLGNARIQGMTEDLNMTGDDYNVALFTFFIT